MYLLLHQIFVFVGPAVVGYLMVKGGLGKSALEPRRQQVCPSCGRTRPTCRCR
jgi:hypothetical protein